MDLDSDIPYTQASVGLKHGDNFKAQGRRILKFGRVFQIKGLPCKPLKEALDWLHSFWSLEGALELLSKSPGLLRLGCNGTNKTETNSLTTELTNSQ